MNTLLSKYKDYKIENEDACKDMPGSNILCGILQNETIETIQRVFGECKIPFWISLTIEDEYYNIPKLRSGEEIVTASIFFSLSNISLKS